MLEIVVAVKMMLWKSLVTASLKRIDRRSTMA